MTQDHPLALASDTTDSASQPEETLVRDPRAVLTPAQVVERKLVALLRSVPLPMSRLEASGPRRPRD